MVNYLTPSGLKALQNELSVIENQKLPEILDAINKAIAEGDLSENASYDSAKEERDKILQRKEEIQSILNSYELVDDSKSIVKSDIVRLGSTVKIKYLHDNSVYKVSIVGTSEADILSNKISNEAPVTKAILGKSKGQEVSFKVKTKEYSVLIEDII